MKIWLFSIIFSLIFIPNVFSLPLESLITAAQIRHLRSGGEMIIETQLRDPSPRLMPASREIQQFIGTVQTALNPGIMVEALFLYEKPAKYHTSNAFWDINQKTGVFNQITAISTLTGIQYYSASRNTMRTFYETSAVVDGSSGRNPLPDPYFYQLPPAFTLFARQKDLTFGDNVYRYDYTASQDVIYFLQENVTTLTYGIIPAVNRGNLRTVISIFDCGDSLIIYAVSMAKAVSLPGMDNKIGDSFSNRAEAILKWFIKKAEIALQ
jgi:hypothetical protein